MPFKTHSRPLRIEWGWCDPAGIVFYPRFFEMFDNSTTLLFSSALGMTKYEFLAKYDCAGYPMVDTRARFLIPARFGDDVVIETTLTEIKRSSFQSAPAQEGRRARGRRFETRCGPRRRAGERPRSARSDPAEGWSG